VVVLGSTRCRVKNYTLHTHTHTYRSKIKYIKINRNMKNLEPDLTMNGHIFEWVQNFRDLGVLIDVKKCK
jgi:hypothetical protein